VRLTPTGLGLLATVLVVALLAGCTAEQPTDTGTETPPAATESAPPESEVATEPTSAPGALPEGATSIAAVLQSPNAGSEVVLAGEITQMQGAENFVLDDGTGQVFVDGDNDFGTLAVGDMLIVTGTVDVEDSPTRVEIQATAVERR